MSGWGCQGWGNNEGFFGGGQTSRGKAIWVIFTLESKMNKQSDEGQGLCSRQ